MDAHPRDDDPVHAGLDHHLEAGEPDGRPNGRNGYGSKTVLTGMRPGRRPLRPTALPGMASEPSGRPPG